MRAKTDASPQSDANVNANYSAVEYAWVSLARKIMRARRAAGLTQVALARKAGIRPETLNRIEKGRTSPDTSTIARIERALDVGG